MQGIVKHVNPRGFGFIIPDGGTHDFFFHMSTILGCTFDQLHEGQRVEFQVGNDPQDRNRRRATQVRLVGEQPDSANDDQAPPHLEIT